MKNKKVIILALISIFILLSLESCVPSKPAYEEETLTAGRLIKKLEANRRKVKTFYGKGVMDIETPKFGGKTTFEIALKKPDSIKVSIYGPLGLDLAEALITQNNFTFYDVMKNRVFTGQNREGVIKEIFKVDLTFDDLMDAFAGAVNLTDKLRNEPDEYLIFDDHYKLVYIDKENNKKSIYNIRAEDMAITNYSVSLDNQDVSFEGIYRKFRNIDEVAIPYNILLNNNSDKQKVDIEYRNLTINDKLEPFKISIPKDAKIIQW